MAASSPKLLPAPLPRVEFLKASHFNIGPDPRLLEGSMKTTVNTSFPAHWDVPIPTPILPVSQRGLFHEDLQKIRVIDSETHTAFPVYDLTNFQSSSNIPMQVSNLRMHADPRINVFKTTFQEKYTCPGASDFNPFIKEARLMFDKDSFPSGDRVKLGIPQTQSRQVFVPQDQIPLFRAPSLHLGGPSHLIWSMDPFPDTTYQKEYQKKSARPAKICEKLYSQLQLGDPKFGLQRIHSEQKKAYTFQGLPQHRYDKEEAAANIFRVHIPPGDGHLDASIPYYKEMAFLDKSELVFKRQSVPVSSLLKGDQNPERCKERSNFTTTHHFYTWMKPKETEPSTSLLKSHVIFGEENRKPKVMVTTHQKYFSYPETSTTKIVRNRSLLETNVKMGTNDMDFLTTMRQKMVPHPVKKNPVPEEIKQRVKYSHILPPQPNQELSTEYKDNYPFKYIGPLVLQEGNFQQSSVPLGSIQKYRAGREVVVPC